MPKTAQAPASALTMATGNDDFSYYLHFETCIVTYITSLIAKYQRLSRFIRLVFTFVLLSVFAKTAVAATVLTSFPDEINAAGKYVFYSHGFIVEGNNPRPINARWGIYEFPAIKQALSAQNYTLIAYHRPAKTDPLKFAQKLAENIRTLLAHGVKAENITLVGFSRGGAITILTSSLLKMDNINFVILAGCSRFMKKNPQYTLYGHVFSIYETSDGVGSCQFVIDRSLKVSSFEELAISTGKEHGAFYQPRLEWLLPVKKWLSAAPE